MASQSHIAKVYKLSSFVVKKEKRKDPEICNHLSEHKYPIVKTKTGGYLSI